MRRPSGRLNRKPERNESERKRRKKSESGRESGNGKQSALLRLLAQHMKAVLVTLSSVVQVTCDPPSSHHRPQLLLCPHILGLTHLPSGH